MVVDRHIYRSIFFGSDGKMTHQADLKMLRVLIRRSVIALAITAAITVDAGTAIAANPSHQTK